LRRLARLVLLTSLAAAPAAVQACRITPSQAQVASYHIGRSLRAAEVAPFQRQCLLPASASACALHSRGQMTGMPVVAGAPVQVTP